MHPFSKYLLGASCVPLFWTHVAVNKTGQVSALVKLTFSLGETDSNYRDREVKNTWAGAKCHVGRTQGWVGVCLLVCIGWSGNASLVRGRLSGDLTQNIPLPLACQVPLPALAWV